MNSQHISINKDTNLKTQSQKQMANQNHYISDLSTYDDKWILKVRVTRIWDAVNNRTKQIISSNAILLDENVSLTLHIYFIQI